MNVTLKIPTQMRELSGGAAQLRVDDVSTVKQVIDKLSSSHPGLVERMMDEDGEIRRFINVYVGDEDIRFLQGLQTPLEEGSVISVLPAVAGGA